MNSGESRYLLEAEQVVKTYQIGRAKVPVLKGISLKVQRGESLSIMGASGAGKSTLLHALGGLERPTSGTVRFDGRDLYGISPMARNDIRALRVGFVFQAYYLLPELDVLENVILPALSRRGATKGHRDLEKRGMGLLERVGLVDRAKHLPTELSGGEQQRAALARALMNEPDIVLADEPTGNLDTETGEHVLRSLFTLVEENNGGLILVSHNETVARMCEKMLYLRDGQLLAN